MWERFKKTFVLEKQESISHNPVFGLVDFLLNRQIDMIGSVWPKIVLANKDGPGRFRIDGDKPDFQTCYYNAADDEQVYNEFVSKNISADETNDKIQFKIIMSKTNREDNLDATVVLCNLMKNDTRTSGDEKERVGTIIDIGTKSIEKRVSGYGKRSRAKPKLLLGQ